MSARTRASACLRVLALALMALTVNGGRGHAQAPASSVEAIPLQGLSFGTLLPGVPERVAVTDAARRAEVLLNGRGTVDLLLVLPDALVSATGARIPLRFGSVDAALLRSSSLAPVPLDPLDLIRVHLQPGHGPARIVVGGTALPSTTQAAGQYQATVTVIVNNPGT